MAGIGIMGNMTMERNRRPLENEGAKGLVSEATVVWESEDSCSDLELPFLEPVPEQSREIVDDECGEPSILTMFCSILQKLTAVNASFVEILTA